MIFEQVRDEMNQVNWILDEFESTPEPWYLDQDIDRALETMRQDGALLRASSRRSAGSFSTWVWMAAPSMG